MIHQTSNTSNKSITPETRRLVEVLAAFAECTAVMEAFKAAHHVATGKLQADPAASAAVETLTLEYFDTVPAVVLKQRGYVKKEPGPGDDSNKRIVV
jgi:hypothetical protein